MLRRPTAENIEALKGSGGTAECRGDAKGPGAVASRRLPRAVKLCRLQSAHARQDPGYFRFPLKIMLDQLNNSLQAQPVNLKTLAGDL